MLVGWTWPSAAPSGNFYAVDGAIHGDLLGDDPRLRLRLFADAFERFDPFFPALPNVARPMPEQLRLLQGKGQISVRLQYIIDDGPPERATTYLRQRSEAMRRQSELRGEFEAFLADVPSAAMRLRHLPACSNGHFLVERGAGEDAKAALEARARAFENIKGRLAITGVWPPFQFLMPEEHRHASTDRS